MSVIELTDANFDQEMGQTDELTVVDFWAPWCGPCRTVAPVIEELAEEMEGKVRFAKVNVDENQETAQRYGVRSIPMLGFFQGSETVGSIVGAYPKPALEQVIEQVQEKLAQEA
jgi:thioredoxin 1